MTVSSSVSASARSAAHDFRLWPDEYEELRDEARGVVKATMEMMSRSVTLPAQSAPATDPAAGAKAAREHMMRTLASPVPEGGGESAGGYLAAAVLLRIRDELGAAGRVAGANLVYGVHDWGRNPSHLGLRATDGPDLLSPESISFFTDAYLPGRTDEERRDPAVSPAFADLHGLPPALLSVGTNDHLLDDTLLLASRWSAAGGDVGLFVGPDLPHGFNGFPCELTRRWTQRTAEWFDRVLSG